MERRATVFYRFAPGEPKSTFNFAWATKSRTGILISTYKSNSFPNRDVFRFLPGWIQTELFHGHPTLTWAWAYLALSLGGSLALMIQQTVSALAGSGSGSPIWVLAAAGLGVFGCGLLRRLVHTGLVVDRDRQRSM